MKKLVVPVICCLIGCVAGVAAPALTAQTFGAPSVGVGTWEQFCEGQSTATVNERMSSWGERGFRVVGVVGDLDNEAVLVCYARPAQPGEGW
ncbi:MAG: hypothetical protein R3B40_15275 [Polyangiales bacterium]|nr:hypothetical protein [Myxococcales bacterium]MCB9658322.1 hypothetical protein [Sandaracinaceae bacterium]